MTHGVVTPSTRTQPRAGMLLELPFPAVPLELLEGDVTDGDTLTTTLLCGENEVIEVVHADGRNVTTARLVFFRFIPKPGAGAAPATNNFLQSETPTAANLASVYEPKQPFYLWPGDKFEVHSASAAAERKINSILFRRYTLLPENVPRPK